MAAWSYFVSRLTSDSTDEFLFHLELSGELPSANFDRILRFLEEFGDFRTSDL